MAFDIEAARRDLAARVKQSAVSDPNNPATYGEGRTEPGLSFDPVAAKASLNGMMRLETRRTALNDAQRTPDESQRIVKIAKALDLPFDAVANDLPAYEQQDYLDRLDALHDTAPKTAQRMQDPEFHALAKDDLDNLTGLELTLARINVIRNAPQILAGLKDAVEDTPLGEHFMLGGKGIDQRLQISALDIWDAMGLDVDARLANRRAAAERTSQQIAAITPEDSGEAPSLYADPRGATRVFFKKHLPGVAQSAPLMAPALIPGVGPILGGSLMGFGVAGTEYADLRTEGVSRQRAVPAAVGAGIAEAIGESLGLKFLKKPFLEAITKGPPIEAAQEFVTQLMQDGLHNLATGKSMTWDQYLDRAKTAAIQGAIMGGAFVTAHGPINLIRNAMPKAVANRKAATLLERWAASTQNMDSIAQLHAFGTASLLGKRSPEQMKAYIDTLSPGGVVYVPAAEFRTLYQDEAPAFAAKLTGAENTLALAGETGDLAIPIGNYVSLVAATPRGAALAQHARLNPDDLSAADLETFDLSAELAKFKARPALSPKLEAETQQIAELRIEQSAWNQWQTNPALVAQLRAEVGLEPTQGGDTIAPKADAGRTAPSVPTTGDLPSREEIGFGQLPRRAVSLPTDAQEEADNTYDQDFLNNAEGDLVWDLRSVPVDPLVDEMYENGVDEDYEEVTDELANDIKTNGLQRPIVIGPQGIEGHHRLLAAQKAGLATVPAYVWRIARQSEAVLSGAAAQHQRQIGERLAELVGSSKHHQRAEQVARIEADVAAQVTATGRFSPSVATQYGKLWGASFATLAQRGKVDAWSLYERHLARVDAGTVRVYHTRDAGGEIVSYGQGEHIIPAGVGLTPRERMVEARAAAQVLANPGAAIAAYDALPGSQGGSIIGADEARELFADYGAGPEGRSSNAFAVHEPASFVAKMALAHRLAGPVRSGKRAHTLVTAGGTGAGKTTATNLVPEARALKVTADIVYDGNLQSFDSAVKKIDQMLASGRNVDIIYVNRDPVDSFIYGAIPRANREDYGRTVPVSAHVGTHIGAAKTYPRLAEHYKNNPRVTFTVINNIAKGVAELGTLQDLVATASLPYNVLEENVNEALFQARAAGQLTDRVARFYYPEVRPEGGGLQPVAAARSGLPQGDGSGNDSVAERGVEAGTSPGRPAGVTLYQGKPPDHKREKSGRYVGAPAWVGSDPKQLTKLRANLAKLARDGEAGRYWYENSSRMILAITSGNVAEAKILVGLLAIFSPKTEVPSNTTKALNAYFKWKTGVPIRGVAMGTNDADARAFLEGRGWEGAKTHAFHDNLLTEIDPSLVQDKATMDLWMRRAFGYDNDSFDQGQSSYRFAQDEVRYLAAKLGWSPHQVQAAIWVKAKADEEGISIDAAALDFGAALAERTLQMSWEATPGKTTGVLPGIHRATIAQLSEYLRAVQDVLAPNGVDRIAALFGVNMQTMFGFSAWEGGIGAGAQSTMPVSWETRKSTAEEIKNGAPATTRHLRAESKRIADAIAATRGYVLNQEMVVYGIPVHTDTKGYHNAVELNIGRPLTTSEARLLYDLLHEKFGTWDAAPAHTATGVRIYNFGAVTKVATRGPNKGNVGNDNAVFQAGIREVMAQFQDAIGETDGTHGFYRSEGDAISNNWGTHPDGQNYRNYIREGSSHLQGGADVLTAHVEAIRSDVNAVNDDFIARYGWDKAVAGDGTADSGLAGSDEEKSPVRFSNQPPGPNAVSAVGVHYSRVGFLPALDPTMAGTNALGAERRRLGMGRIGLHSPRLFFYIQEGDTLPAGEPVVRAQTSHAYTVRLDNLYDLTADPLGIRAATPNNPDAIEEAITDAGFDGFLADPVPGIDDRTAVVFGFKSEVPVRTLYQSMLQQGGERGSIQIAPDSTMAISLFATADRSTFLHESGHFFLEIMGTLSRMQDVDPKLVADYATTLDYLGAVEGQPLTREQHELFARTFEAYLFEGKSPNPALNGMFARFRAWLLQLYQGVEAFDTKISPEIRGVMDRLVATDEQIAAAQDRQGMRPLVTKAIAKAIGMTDVAWGEYTEALASATEQARADVTAQLLRVLKSETTAARNAERAQVRAAVETELAASPLTRALQVLQGKGTLNGEPMPEALKGLKLARESLTEEQRKAIGTSMYRANGGATPDEVATILGFPDGKTLLDALAARAQTTERVTAETERRLAERHPDPLTDGSLPDRATRALYGSRRVAVVEMELTLLAGLAKAPAPNRRQLKALAEAIVAGKPIGQNRPHDHLASERRAGEVAIKAAAKGDYAAALQAKHEQALQQALYRAAMAASDKVAVGVRYAKKFQRPKSALRARLGKTEFLDQIQAIMERFDFRAITGRETTSRASLRAWVASRQAAGEAIDLPESILDEANRQPYKTMTLEQFNTVIDAIKRIDNLSGRWNKLMLGEQSRDRAAVDAEAADDVLNRVDRSNRYGYESFADQLREASYGMRSVSAPASDLARQLGGFSDAGGLWNHTVRVIREAWARVNARKLAEGNRLAATYLRHYTRGEIGRLETPFHIDGFPRGVKWTRGSAISLALTLGHQGGRDALANAADSRFTPAQVAAVLKTLTPADVAFIGDVLAHVDSFWAEIAATYQRRTGIVPKRVKALPFIAVIADGTTVAFPGGYFPLAYAYKSRMREAIDDYNDQLRAGGFVAASTENGFTIARVGSGGRSVNLSLGTIETHLNDVVTDLLGGDAVNYVHKVLHGPRLVKAIQATDGTKLLTALDVWLQDVATGEIGVRETHEKVARFVRQNFVAAALTYKAVTSLLQIGGIVQSSVVLGPGYSAYGVKELVTHPGRWTDYIAEHSPFMVARGSVHPEMVQQLADARMGRVMSFRSWEQRWGFYLMGRVQRVVDLQTWIAAEQMGLGQGMDADKARAFADDLVARAQGSFDFNDKSALQRGTLGLNVRQSEYIRATTALMGYMLAKGNIIYEKTATTNFRSPGQALRWAGNMVILVTLDQVIVSALRGDLPDDDDDDGSKADDFLAFAAKETGLSILGSFPGANLMAESLRGYDGGGVVRGLFGNIAAAYVQTRQYVKDGEGDAAMRRAYIKLLGAGFGIPSGQINKTMDAMDAEREGETVQPWRYLTGPKRTNQ